MSCLWAMTLLSNILLWLLTLLAYLRLSFDEKTSRTFVFGKYEWIKLRRFCRFFLLVHFKRTKFHSLVGMKGIFKEFFDRKQSRNFSLVKVLWKRSFHVDSSKISNNRDALCSNPAQCSSWRGSLHSTQNPTYSQMSSIKPYIPSIVYSNVSNRASFTFFSPSCFRAIQSLFDCFPFQASFRHFSWCQYAPIMLRSMKMHSRKTENIKQMLAVVFLDTSVLAFFLSSTMADADGNEWKLKATKRCRSKFSRSFAVGTMPQFVLILRLEAKINCRLRLLPIANNQIEINSAV